MADEISKRAVVGSRSLRNVLVAIGICCTALGVLGIFLPLITSNCAVLGVALLNVQEQHNLLQSALYGFGASTGFGLVLILFSAMRERLAHADVPVHFRGAPIALVTAGLAPPTPADLAAVALPEDINQNAVPLSVICLSGLPREEHIKVCLGFNILKRLLQQIVACARPDISVELEVILGHALVVSTSGICIHFPHLPSDLFQVIKVFL